MKEKAIHLFHQALEKRRFIFLVGILFTIFFFLYELAPFVQTELLDRIENINGYQLLSFLSNRGDVPYDCGAVTVLVLLDISLLFFLSLAGLFVPEKALPRLSLSFFVLLFLKLAFDIARTVLFANLQANFMIATCGYLLSPIDALLFFAAFFLYVNWRDRKEPLLARKEREQADSTN